MGSVKDGDIHDDQAFWNLPEDDRKEKRTIDIETISNNTLNVL